MISDNRYKQLIDANGGSFKPKEFLPGRQHMKKKMIKEFILFRNWHGWMTQITSAYRSTGSHVYGTAIDFLLWSEWQTSQPSPEQIWRVATTWPWMGVGIYFDWNDGIGLHVDLVTQTQRQRPLRWLRVNGLYHYQALNDGLFYNYEMDRITSIGEQINNHK